MGLLNKMKIAYFLDVSYGLGGAGNLLLQQAVLMSSIYDVIVVIPCDDEGVGNEEYIRRCQIKHISYKILKYKTSYDFYNIDYIEARDNREAIKNFAIEEKISFFHSVQLNIAVEMISRELHIPHLMNIYQLQKKEFIICPGDIYAHYHLCDSLLYCKVWSEQLNLISKCIRPVAPKKKIKRKSLWHKKTIKLLMLGGVCQRKNQMSAIKIIEQCIHYYEVELHIAGDDNNYYAEECKSYVKRQGLEKVVFFHGFVSNIIPLLENGDCLLCASTDESFPSSIVEALTYDLTIISTPVAGVPEIFIDKKNSFISQDFTEGNIKKSILECLEYYKDGKIIDIHKNAEDAWRENFERNTVRIQMNLFYQEIMADCCFKDVSPFAEIEKDIEQIEIVLKEIDENIKKLVYKRILYYSFISKHLRTGEMYIWGAGKFGKIALEIYKKICPNLDVIAFIDTYQEGIYCGIPVIKPEDALIKKSSFYSVSFTKGKEQAIQYLEDKGLVLYRQIWNVP